MSNQLTSSGFWLDESLFEKSNYSNNQQRTADDLVKMASVKRAIANFVRIVTGEYIKVGYSNGDKSFTNGKQVTISGAAVKEKNFDAAVGLALHEGSHIKLSNFTLLEHLSNQLSMKKGTPMLIPTKTFEDAVAKYNIGEDASDANAKQIRMTVIKRIKNLLNWIEDRRVDFYIYNTAPGYKGYYKAMYKKYFENSIVDKGLKSASYRKENWASYMFRIGNIININRDLDALKELKRIAILLDLNHIDRLKNSEDSLKLALEIYDIIESAVPAPELQKKKEEKKKEDNEPYLIGYTAKGLPNGVTIDKRKGKLMGKITEAGEYKVIITAHYSDKSKDRRKLKLIKK